MATGLSAVCDCGISDHTHYLWQKAGIWLHRIATQVGLSGFDRKQE